MSQPRIEELKKKSQAVLSRSMGQLRAAALLTALVPLAAVAATPAVASAQSSGSNGSGGYSVPSPCDFVTSGGFVINDAGGKVTFGAHGGCKLGAFRGSMTVSYHTEDYHVDLTEITGYFDVAPTLEGPSVMRDICGVARSSRNEVLRFRLRLEDHDEPGIADRFGLRLSTGYYYVSTRLLGDGGSGGGNVQLHTPNKTNVGPANPGNEETMCFGLEAP